MLLMIHVSHAEVVLADVQLELSLKVMENSKLMKILASLVEHVLVLAQLELSKRTNSYFLVEHKKPAIIIYSWFFYFKRVFRRQNRMRACM